jgi:hypothetical protein
MMKRSTAIFVIMLLILLPSTAQAAPSLKDYVATTGSSQPQIVWALQGLGRLSADMQFAPNGQILLPLTGQLASVDSNGELQWEARTTGGNPGFPVCTADGSIYVPSSSSLQEFKPDGAPGWMLTAYPDTGGAADQWLGYGQGNLYFPHVSGLYILNPDGQFNTISPWDSGELQATELPSSYSFITGIVTLPAVSQQQAGRPACYTVLSTVSDEYQMTVFDARGNYLWDYGLGDLKQACIAAGGDGTVFLAAEPSITNRVTRDMVSSFAPGGSQPQWQTGINESASFLGLTPTSGNLYLALAGEIYALNTSTGSIEWDVPFTNLTSPVAVDDQTGCLYAGCSDGSLLGIDPAGKLAWDLSLDSGISTKPLVGDDGFLYVATNSGTLYKIKLNSQ